MKKISFILLIVGMLNLFCLSLPIEAEVTGGAIYTTLELDNLNEDIDKRNNILKASREFGLKADYMEKIDNANGVYLGIYTPVSPELKFGVEYENIFPVESDFEVGYLDDDEYRYVEGRIELDLEGVVGNFKHEISEHLMFTGGVGYYCGEISYSGSKIIGLENEASSLEGIGLKGGLEINYPLDSSLLLSGSVNCRKLTLKEEDYNFSDDNELDGSGVEIKGGIVCKF